MKGHKTTAPDRLYFFGDIAFRIIFQFSKIEVEPDGFKGYSGIYGLGLVQLKRFND
jgi:hypothetical protein